MPASRADRGSVLLSVPGRFAATFARRAESAPASWIRPVGRISDDRLASTGIPSHAPRSRRAQEGAFDAEREARSIG